MGLTITPIETPITISGTALELDSAYARIIFRANADGLTMEIAYQIYASNAMYLEQKTIATDIQQSNFTVTLDPLTQVQSIDVALEFAKLYFEQLGYTAVIVVE